MFYIWLATVIVTLTLYLWKVYSKFSKHGVKYIRPIPFLGNSGKLAINKSHVADDFKRLYNAFPAERFIGHFELMRPVIMIKDLDLIKQITVKDFEHFHDHRHMVDESVDPLFGRNLVTLKGQEWKDMRSTLSPVFTSVKMRAMIPFMLGVNDQMIRLIRKKIEQTKTGYADIDSKDVTTAYSNDVIASCGFGMRVDSHTDSENEFYSQAKSTAHFGFRRVLVFLGYGAFPNLMKKLNVKMFNEKANDYFVNLFNNTILEREKNHIFRPDMIHLLLEAKRGNLKHIDNNESKNAGFASVEESDVGKRSIDRSWSDSDLVAQAIFFFVASFESISGTMCFLLYEVAVNPEVQERLVKEFKDNDAKNTEFDYYALQNLKYLDMVISEVLRFWPFGIGIDRVCTNNYNLGKPNDKATSDYIIKEGELIIIPTCAIHHDPKYFPNPNKFDPERFSDTNRMNIKPYTYMPFGTGPRNCIGSRFALLEMKVMIYHLLLQFELSPAEKTRIPAKLLPSAFTLAMQGGHWIRFKPRM